MSRREWIYRTIAGVLLFIGLPVGIAEYRMYQYNLDSNGDLDTIENAGARYELYFGKKRKPDWREYWVKDDGGRWQRRMLDTSKLKRPLYVEAGNKV